MVSDYSLFLNSTKFLFFIVIVSVLCEIEAKPCLMNNKNNNNIWIFTYENDTSVDVLFFSNTVDRYILGHAFPVITSSYRYLLQEYRALPLICKAKEGRDPAWCTALYCA